MIFPAQPGGMSSLASLVPPGFGVRGPCAVHRGRRGWPGCLGRAAGLAACRGGGWALSHQGPGEMPAEPGNKGQRGRGRVGVSGDWVPVGSPGSHWWVTPHFLHRDHNWLFLQHCSDVRTALPGVPAGKRHPWVGASAPTEATSALAMRHHRGAGQLPVTLGDPAPSGWDRDLPGPCSTG